MLTGEFPNEEEIEELRKELYIRSRLQDEAEALLRRLPKNMHPMTQLSMGIMSCQPASKFVAAYQEGIHKTKYWEPVLEDALDVIAKIGRIAAIVYHNCYKEV